MLIRASLLILFTLLSIACARAPSHSLQTPATIGSSVQTRTVSSFNQVDAAGLLNVTLHTGYSRPQVVLKGDPRDLAQATTVVSNNVLIIRAGNPRFGAISADVRGKYLNSFIYKGVGTINGPNVYSGLLDLNITNSGATTLAGNIYLRKLEIHGGNVQITGVKAQNLQLIMSDNAKVQLAGVANISNLTLDGDGSFGMYWVKSNFLRVCARGKTFVQLAGVANKLDVELWDNARFNGRYLRAKRNFTKTHDHSIAEITALDRQHTLATDASDIYFYKIPDMKMDFMAYNGAVLDMRDWNRLEMRDYDRFNKQP